MMLDSAVKFKDMFPRYRDIDVGFNYVPTESEWIQVKDVCRFLEVFDEITKMISGSEYPTANIFLPELYRIKELLIEKSLDPSFCMRSMAKKMAAKFDKYWGDSNVLISLGVILDPRYKMELIEFVFPIIYGKEESKRYIDEIKKVLYDLYAEYVMNFNSEERPPQKQKHSEIEGSSNPRASTAEKEVLSGKARFQLYVSKSQKLATTKIGLGCLFE